LQPSRKQMAEESTGHSASHMPIVYLNPYSPQSYRAAL
jgi:hypothetical protein